ncbi:MAG TPA: patatin-like phospholipase family protein [Longimicrobium sp.]|jgi:NTE family protein|uniref:patatin-like phospholipase family protein n=1 Tax=Longimicrobium sp. TaxID=2029185 RepID=UPI002ED93ED1
MSEFANTSAESRSPAMVPGGEHKPEPGIGLCLSGGGYRAMLFHAGVIWRLNELGILHELKRISSVSGGSLTAAMLGLHWRSLRWLQVEGRTVASDLTEQVIEPIQRLARHTVDGWSVGGGAVLPGVSISELVERAYRKHLFGEATLQDLPADGEGPRFVINATNVQSGVLWRFSRKFMADYRVGMVANPDVSLALAVTASSAFPPVLSPARMELPPGLVQKSPGATEDLHEEPYTTDIYLTDGGVYDNLGLETVWKRYETVLVSDGGGQMAPEAQPHSDWARHALRVNGIIDNQVRSLRKRQVVDSLVAGDRKGAYWRTRGDIRDYPAPKTLPCPIERTTELAELDTRLKAMDRVTQERLINWGYALSDAAVRGWVNKNLPPPDGFPFPASKV